MKINLGKNIKQDFALAKKIAGQVKKNRGRALVVGGFVRDLVMKKPLPKDIDLEVYGISERLLQSILKKFGPVNLIGQSFAVFKLKGLDISLPRKDSKTGKGHKGFKIVSDSNLSVKEAMRRRDFTINALALDPLTEEVVDEVGGIKDLQGKVLRAVDLKLFGDDPLRVLRAVQFAGRFGLMMDIKTLAVCKKIVSSGQLGELSHDRIREEWVKLWLKAPTPSSGLKLAKEMGILKKYFPIFEKMEKTKQEPAWHPEGDVFTHTCEVIDRAAKIANKNQLQGDDRLVFMLAALCHDLGKAVTTKPRLVHGVKRITSHNHSEAGVPLAKEVIKDMHIPLDIQKKVLPLIAEHMFIFHSRIHGVTDAALRRLMVRLYPATLNELVMVAEADYPGYQPAIIKLLKQAQKLDKQATQTGKIKPILAGKHLIQLGFKPGPEMGKMLKAVFQHQIDGKIKTLAEAKALVKKRFKK